MGLPQYSTPAVLVQRARHRRFTVRNIVLQTCETQCSHRGYKDRDKTFLPKL